MLALELVDWDVAVAATNEKVYKEDPISIL
jgi:hypothetical protein